MTDLRVSSLADRPDLIDQFWRVEGARPMLVEQSPVSAQHYAARKPRPSTA